MSRRGFSRSQKFASPFAILAIAIVTMAMLALFQNCSAGFSIDPNAIGASMQTSSGSLPLLGVNYANFKACRSGGADLYSCLEAASEVKGFLRATDVATCVAAPATTPTDLEVAMCLTKVGFPVFNYREPLQTDIDNCAVKVGTAKIAECLQKNAILPTSVTQIVIENCVSIAGLGKVEKCLRGNAHLAKVPFISNSDVSLCVQVTEQATNSAVLFSCLANREVLPGSVIQADIDFCMTTSAGAIAKCLRTNRKVSRVLMQNNIASCAASVGTGKAASCLESNGYLYDNLLPVSTLQTTIDDCATTVGVSAIAKCLRARAALERPLMQLQISACAAAVGADKVVSCLIANGLVDPATGLASNSAAGTQILQADVDACGVSAGSTGIAKCLVNVKRTLSPTALQANFEFCARLNDSTGIAACLDASGMLPTTTANGPATQANFDTCLAAAGLSGLETCLRTRGFIP